MNWCEIIKETLPMQAILERYIGSPDRKRWLCPFHQDTHPSLSVNEKTNKFKCFSCGAQGDGTDFVQKYFKCSQKEALLILNKDFNLGLTTENENPHQVERIKQSREIERQNRNETEQRCREQRKRIRIALRVARDILNYNKPHGEKIETYALTKSIDKCLWATLQEEYCLWLLDCLDGVPLDENKCYFYFDLDVLNKNPMSYAGGENMQWRLGARKRKVLEMLEKGELDCLWLFRNITMSA